ncbi:hypothetical protein N9L13_07880 [Flavobacteriales bacterium]|nr:hypothetical protein [Flavobacteriales bacterium]
MKHLLTAIACFFALSMSAQTPYNPDFDDDGFITVVDLLAMLDVFGQNFTAEVLDDDPVVQIVYCDDSKWLLPETDVYIMRCEDFALQLPTLEIGEYRELRVLHRSSDSSMSIYEVLNPDGGVWATTWIINSAALCIGYGMTTSTDWECTSNNTGYID